MGQDEVLNFLKDKRSKTEEWFTIPQIVEEMKQLGFENGTLKGIHEDTFRLSIFGKIQNRVIGFWNARREFRAFKTK